MAWQVKSRNGIWLPQIDWWLDAHKPAPRSVISHAHADHVARHGEAICTPATAALIEARSGKPKSPPRTIEFDCPISLTPTATLTLVPAGHVLGSAQALISHPEYGRLLYTGDFKLRPSGTAETCATPAADVLIMETTFARSHYVFPPAETVFRDVIAFCRETLAQGEIPVLLGYSLGRSQEILHGLSDADLPLMLHPMVEKVTRVYESHDVTFPAYTSFAPMFAPGHVIITPAQALKGELFSAVGPIRTAVLTGWAIDTATRYRHACDAAFPLSDHAGYEDLLEFVRRVNPRRVYTVHGFADEFAATLRQRGIDAWALGRNNQLELTF
ncbi:MBL fold metallo-hydrolase RNA specificity domain-containing protein [Synoicihabitans lomoniglobus]|uniref:MBL fold metallo-hydrolase n=1 Tax=Synoicihabitans lomoniglobus TaxID=2909285 RepID=A0AAF0I4U5_9BACT|nr:MBL fold metallo-hydrolase [Opitutaceae bacterium LMO-M01]WED67018.1 MBL fold metallo-hydrolase [Opitutaceae bacterium LMO-M01]